MKSRIIALVLGLLATVLAIAQTDADVEQYWPCVQRYIDTIYADIYWPESIARAETRWQQNTDIRQAAAVLADEYADEVEMESAIVGIESTYAEGKEAGLQVLFIATIHAMNNERQRYLRGIIDHEKGQARLARELEESLNTLDKVRVEEVEMDIEQRQELNRQIQWQQRIFQQRNDQIIAMCELPVELEERAAALAQQLRGRL